MPYFQDDNLLDKDKDPAQVQISGASPTTQGDGNLSPTQGGQKKPLDTGSGYQNLDSYLNSNQSQQFGQQVHDKVGGDVKAAQQNMQDAGNAFTTRVKEANNTPTSDQLNSSIANPTGADAKQFQTWENQSYQGPNSLAEDSGNYNKYWSGAGKANTSAQLLGSEPGRFTLLDSYFGKPSYNNGQKSLDNLLVQQSGLGQDTRNLQNQATSLKTTGANQEKQLAGVAANRAGEVDQSRKATRAAIGLDDQGSVIQGANAGALGQSYQQALDTQSSVNQGRKSQQDSLTQSLGQNAFTQDQLNQLGLSQGQDLYGIDNLGKYVTLNPAELSRNQAFTPEQKARIQALQQLAGVQDDFASGSSDGVNDPYVFNKAGFQSDLAAGKASQQAAAERQRQAQLSSLQKDYNNQFSSLGNGDFGDLDYGRIGDLQSQIDQLRGKDLSSYSNPNNKKIGLR